MSAKGESLSILGQFLLLAFLLPGLIYTAFIYIYFPRFWPALIDVNNWAGLFGVVVFTGLTGTSICFAIEWLILIPHVYPKFRIKAPDISLLGRLEAHGKSTVYLNQVFSQYIMHLNIAIGVFLLSVLYLVISLWDFGVANLPRHFVSYFMLGIIVAGANAYVTMIFSRFSQKAASGYREVIGSNKSITFDLDNTLVKTYEVYRDANMVLVQWVQKLGARIPDIDTFVQQIFTLDRNLVAKSHSSDYDKTELLNRICEFAEVKPSGQSEALSAYQKALEKIPETKENAYETLALLSKKKYNLILVSEGKEERIRKVVAHYKFDQIFDRIMPLNVKNQKTFNKLAEDLRHDGFAKLYLVGDSIRKDILMGNVAGFETIWLPSMWELSQPGNREEWPHYRIRDLIEVTHLVG